MALTSAQHCQIAAAYERAAQDQTLPPQPRAGFAKKAQWFRMLAQIGAAKEEVSGQKSCANAQPESPLCAGFLFEALNRRCSETTGAGATAEPVDRFGWSGG